MSFQTDYFRMVAQWQKVCSRNIPTSEKTDACITILRGLIGRLALLSVDATNPTLRFYAYMLVLRQYVAPGPGCGDELGQTAVIPAARLVDGWLRDNAVDRCPKRTLEKPMQRLPEPHSL